MPEIKARVSVISIGKDPWDPMMAWMVLRPVKEAPNGAQDQSGIPVAIHPSSCGCDHPMPFPMMSPQMIQEMSNVIRWPLSMGTFNALKPQIGDILTITFSRPEGS